MKTLINFKNEINVISPIYVDKLGFARKITNINSQNIDSLALKIYKMITEWFLVKNRLKKISFYKKLFYWLTLV